MKDQFTEGDFSYLNFTIIARAFDFATQTDDAGARVPWRSQLGISATTIS